MKSLFITIFMLILSASAFAEYVKIALPKSSEIEGDNAKFYAKGALAVDMADESEVRRVGEFVDALMSAGSEEFAAMLKKPELASKSAKFLKLARLGKGANLFAFKFGKLTIAVFEIPSGSRMRAGMNFFALENVGSGESGGLRWNVSFNNPMVVLAAQCAFTNPQKLDFSGLVAKSEKDGVLLEKACGADMPFSFSATTFLLGFPPTRMWTRTQPPSFTGRFKMFSFRGRLTNMPNLCPRRASVYFWRNMRV